MDRYQMDFVVCRKNHDGTLTERTPVVTVLAGDTLTVSYQVEFDGYIRDIPTYSTEDVRKIRRSLEQIQAGLEQET